eukprot:gene12723-15969_t
MTNNMNLDMTAAFVVMMNALVRAMLLQMIACPYMQELTRMTVGQNHLLSFESSTPNASPAYEDHFAALAHSSTATVDRACHHAAQSCMQAVAGIDMYELSRTVRRGLGAEPMWILDILGPPGHRDNSHEAGPSGIGNSHEAGPSCIGRDPRGPSPATHTMPPPATPQASPAEELVTEQAPRPRKAKAQARPRPSSAANPRVTSKAKKNATVRLHPYSLAASYRLSADNRSRHFAVKHLPGEKDHRSPDLARDYQARPCRRVTSPKGPPPPPLPSSAPPLSLTHYNLENRKYDLSRENVDTL